MNDYYSVTCPHCRRGLVIRLHPDETGVTPCQCKRHRLDIEWGQVTTEQPNGKQTTAYGPTLKGQPCETRS